jgi:preprotein translocase subunit SecG
VTDPQNPAVPPADGAVPPAPAPAPAPNAYAAAPPPAYAPPASGSEPGKTLGIVALIVVFFFSLIGLILGYVARSQSKKAGVKNTPAKIAIILGWVFIALSIIVGIIIAAVVIPAAAELVRACAELGPGTHTLSDGRILTCGNS